MNRRRRILASAAIALALAVTGALAQQNKENPEQQGVPGKEHKQLEPLVGSWDVSIQYKLDGKVREGSAESEAKWILDGRHLQQEYKSMFMGRPLTVLQFLGYDQQKKKFFEIKMDSMDTGLMHNEGTMSQDGKVITFAGERIDPITGKPGKLHTVTTIVDPDHYTVEWYWMVGDEREEKVVTLTHTRKKL